MSDKVNSFFERMRGFAQGKPAPLREMTRPEDCEEENILKLILEISKNLLRTSAEITVAVTRIEKLMRDIKAGRSPSTKEITEALAAGLAAGGDLANQISNLLKRLETARIKRASRQFSSDYDPDDDPPR